MTQFQHNEDPQSESAMGRRSRAIPPRSTDMLRTNLNTQNAQALGTANHHGGDRYHKPVPFAWQQDRLLLLLDEEIDGFWVMAELWFDDESCRYIENRRATYRWPREAMGALLCRILPAGDATASAAAISLNTWFLAYHVIHQPL